MRDKLLYPTRRAFSPNCVHTALLIHPGRSRSIEKERQGRRRLETRGDIIIWELWESKTEATIDVRLGDPECDTHKKEPMGMLLAWWEKEKKDKNGKHCHKQQKRFPPFVLPVYGMLGKEALCVLVNLS